MKDKRICTATGCPKDDNLWTRIYNSLDDIYDNDPYGLCSCGHTDNHDGECQLEMILYDFVRHFYVFLGGKFFIRETFEKEDGTQYTQITEEK